jgi:hypothetical protein
MVELSGGRGSSCANLEVRDGMGKWGAQRAGGRVYQRCVPAPRPAGSPRQTPGLFPAAQVVGSGPSDVLRERFGVRHLASGVDPALRGRAFYANGERVRPQAGGRLLRCLVCAIAEGERTAAPGHRHFLQGWRWPPFLAEADCPALQGALGHVCTAAR